MQPHAERGQLGQLGQIPPWNVSASPVELEKIAGEKIMIAFQNHNRHKFSMHDSMAAVMLQL